MLIIIRTKARSGQPPDCVIFPRKDLKNSFTRFNVPQQGKAAVVDYAEVKSLFKKSLLPIRFIKSEGSKYLYLIVKMPEMP